MHSFLLLCLVFYNSVESQALDLSNWMEQKSSILWNLTLQEMTILGTHDSGAYNLTCTQIPTYEPEWLEVLIYVGEELGIPLCDLIKIWGKAQPSSLYDQMMYGVRYIDLRCGWLTVPEEWVTFHWEAGNSIQLLMNDVARFLKENTKEIVLIEASHLDGEDIDNKKLSKLVKIFEDTLGTGTGIGLFPRNDSNPYYFPTYGEMINNGYRAFVSLANNNFASNYSNIQYSGVFQNTYADSPDLNKMIEFNNQQVTKFNNNKTNSHSLFKISWTLTPDGDSILGTLEPGKPHTLLELADIADAQMWNWTESKFEQNLRIGNVFIFDDYPKAATEQILNTVYSSFKW